MSIYMCGMWTIPFVWILVATFFTRKGATQEDFKAIDLLQAAAVATLVFACAEHFTVPLQLWVKTAAVRKSLGHIAIYVLPAEGVLGSAVLMAYRCTRRRSVGWQLFAGASVAIFYTGALNLSYLFIEKRAQRESSDLDKSQTVGVSWPVLSCLGFFFAIFLAAAPSDLRKHSRSRD